LEDRGLVAPVLFSALANRWAVGVRAGAVEDPVEEVVGDVGPCRAAKNAQHDVEHRVRQGIVDGGPHKGQQDLDDLPTAGAQKTYDGTRRRPRRGK
jgi:hypothetical protein